MQVGGIRETIKTTGGVIAEVRAAQREALAQYRLAQCALDLLETQRAVRPWTPIQATEAARLGAEAARRRRTYEQLALRLSRLWSEPCG